MVANDLVFKSMNYRIIKESKLALYSNNFDYTLRHLPMFCNTRDDSESVMTARIKIGVILRT